MGGFMGVGGSSAKTDRSTELSTRGDLQNVFNWAMPQGKAGQGAGAGALNQAQQYFSNLLTAGRTQTAANAAPAINAATAQSDTARRQEAVTGTSRGGGTAGANREASTTQAKTIDDIINQNLVGGRQAGAKGLEETGEAQLRNSLALLGLGEDVIAKVMEDARKSRPVSQQINQQTQQQWGETIGSLLMLPSMLK